jgi:hypothetical protein
VLAAVALAVLACGTAYAYWSATGSGTGSTSSSDTSALTINPGTPTASLYPGGSAGVSLTISNPNTATVQVNTLALDTTQGSGGFAVDSAHSGCTLSSLSFAPQTNGGSGWSVPGRSGSTNGSLSLLLPNALSMAVTAPNACQGATFTIYLAAS